MIFLRFIPNRIKDYFKKVFGIHLTLWQPSECINKIEFSVSKFGLSYFYTSNGYNPLWHTIYETFDYDCYFFSEVRSFLNDSTFFDIGANIGVVTVLASSQGAEVIAIEPDPSNIKFLNKNLELNSLSNVKIIEGAISAINLQTIELNMNGSVSNSSIVLNDSSHKIKVPTISIGNLLKEAKASKKYKILKMDIEGEEHNVFSQPDFLLTDFDFYLIEVHDISKVLGLKSFLKLFDLEKFQILIKKDPFGRKFLHTLMIKKIGVELENK